MSRFYYGDCDVPDMFRIGTVLYSKDWKHKFIVIRNYKRSILNKLLHRTGLKVRTEGIKVLLIK